MQKQLNLQELLKNLKQGNLENTFELIEEEMEKERQEAFMEGYKYAIYVLQDTIPNKKEEQL